MHYSQAFLALALPILTAAHFNLNYPPARGFDEDALVNFPCGGQDTVSKTRTQWPMTGGDIQLEMGHDQANVQVLLGLGNDPAPNFNITLRPIFTEQGLGDFCMTGFSLPSGVTVKDGDNATIQVVTNGDGNPPGGLYNCADITFESSAPAPGSCKNGSGVVAMAYSGTGKNANGSDSGTSTSGTASSTSATATATKNPAAAVVVEGGMLAMVFGALAYALAL